MTAVMSRTAQALAKKLKSLKDKNEATEAILKDAIYCLRVLSTAKCADDCTCCAVSRVVAKACLIKTDLE